MSFGRGASILAASNLNVNNNNNNNQANRFDAARPIPACAP